MRYGANEFMDVKAFCERVGITTRTALRWRQNGEGPAYVRAGPRRLLYRIADVEQWERSRTYAHRAAEMKTASAL